MFRDHEGVVVSYNGDVAKNLAYYPKMILSQRRMTSRPNNTNQFSCKFISHHVQHLTFVVVGLSKTNSF